MAKFFEILINKFFDFFNFGRFITIIIPGMIAALCLAMLVSQILFPAGKEKQDQPATKVQVQEKIETSTETKDKDSSRKKVESTTTSKEATTNEKGLGLKTAEQGAVEKEDNHSRFHMQLSDDFKRVSGNFSLVLLLTIVIGLMLYEIGYRIILLFSSRGERHKLHRYDSNSDGDDKLTHKFGFSKEPVGLVYFAPFLKEKFSGEENYFNFLVTEYYRFLEFSVIMPISIIMSALITLAYYALFCTRHSCSLYLLEMIISLTVLFMFPILFLFLVCPKIFESYKKASKDLVQGISDMMSKGLINK